MKPSKKSVAVWSVFLLSLAVVFFSLELPAVANDIPGDTLSEVIWYWMGSHPIASAFISLVFVWIAVHMVGRGRWDGWLVRGLKKLIRGER